MPSINPTVPAHSFASKTCDEQSLVILDDMSSAQMPIVVQAQAGSDCKFSPFEDRPEFPYAEFNCTAPPRLHLLVDIPREIRDLIYENVLKGPHRREKMTCYSGTVAVQALYLTRKITGSQPSAFLG